MPNLDLINQEFNEKRYSRHHIDGYIRESIQANPVMQAKIADGIKHLEEWLSQDYYDSKNQRLEQVKHLDLNDLVLDIFVGIAYIQTEELFTSVTAQMAGRLKWDDRVAAITTIAEIIAVLCRTDAFDIMKASRMASLVIVSRIPLEQSLLDHIRESQYLPPMVTEPRKLVNNRSSGYLSHNDSLILGNGNHHEGDICLDVLNIMNRVPLALVTDLLCQEEEEPTFDLDTEDKKLQWKNFKVQSYRFYDLLVKQGNRFYLTHKVDKRGRIYAQGYHINTQGASFKKAMIELADEEFIEGVPGY